MLKLAGHPDRELLRSGEEEFHVQADSLDMGQSNFEQICNVAPPTAFWTGIGDSENNKNAGQGGEIYMHTHMLFVFQWFPKKDMENQIDQPSILKSRICLL